MQSVMASTELQKAGAPERATGLAGSHAAKEAADAVLG